ncbi:hypothetical protein EI555_017915 [Monodon monoceros]|uniref:Uncharacterized protein n=1 Tax=Monodon monoceros TaxID=40151 RepID=A0A4U1FSX1_MONMO|nr:hypothetical protein EI555_017915 [Monodon monoceros]
MGRQRRGKQDPRPRARGGYRATRRLGPPPRRRRASKTMELTPSRGEKEKEDEPPPPPRSGRVGDRAAPPISRGNERLPAPLNCQVLVLSGVGSRVQRVSALSPRPHTDRQPPLHAPRSALGLRLGTRRRRCQQPAPSWSRPADPRTRRPGCRAKGPAPATTHGACRRPYLLEKGPPEPRPRGSAPGRPARVRGARVPSARGCGALGAGAVRAARPAGPVTTALRPVGGAGVAGGRLLPTLSRAEAAPLSPLPAPSVLPFGLSRLSLGCECKNEAHSANFSVRTFQEARQQEGKGVARTRVPCAVAQSRDLARASPLGSPIETKATSGTVAVVTRGDE